MATLHARQLAKLVNRDNQTHIPATLMIDMNWINYIISVAAEDNGHVLMMLTSLMESLTS